jgi:hypothetical protein
LARSKYEEEGKKMVNIETVKWFRHNGHNMVVADVLWTNDNLFRYTWTPSEGWAEHKYNKEMDSHITIEGLMPIKEDF